MMQAYEKCPSAALHSSFVTAADSNVQPHSSGFRAPCTWTFLVSLRDCRFSGVSRTKGSRKARFNKSGGFTLLEVMVAVAILGIAMTAIHYGQAQSLRAQARTQNVTLATMKAMEKMDEVLTSKRLELPQVGQSEEGTFEPPYEFLHWSLLVEENAILPEMIKDVRLTVFWDIETEGRPSRSDALEAGGNKVEVCLYVANL